MQPAVSFWITSKMSKEPFLNENEQIKGNWNFSSGKVCFQKRNLKSTLLRGSYYKGLEQGNLVGTELF
jgi:hypothetical protein